MKAAGAVGQIGSWPDRIAVDSSELVCVSALDHFSGHVIISWHGLDC